jgi:hypothetical protein
LARAATIIETLRKLGGKLGEFLGNKLLTGPHGSIDLTEVLLELLEIVRRDVHRLLSARLLPSLRHDTLLAQQERVTMPASSGGRPGETREQFIARYYEETKDERAAEARETKAISKRCDREARARRPRTGFKETCGELLRTFGLLSSDPYIARISMIQEAERQIGIQRQIQAERAVEERQFEIAQRRADQADEERRMKIMAREMAKEMFAEADRRRNA